jgi:hypothetical protein
VKERQLSNAETAKAIREWVSKPQGPFSWPTDGCGYNQHIRYVKHRNTHWGTPEIQDYKKFVLDYADSLEKETSSRRPE